MIESNTLILRFSIDTDAIGKTDKDKNQEVQASPMHDYINKTNFTFQSIEGI